MIVTVYHNPRCSKSRETIKLLEAQHVDFNTRLYLQEIPTISELKNLVILLGFQSVRELMRTKESIYKELRLAEVHDEAALLAALHENPKLIERPIVVTDNAAKIGRPPESVLTLLSENNC